MFCRKCGSQIPDGSGFCHKCGTPVGCTAGGGMPEKTGAAAGRQPAGSMYCDRSYGPFSIAGWFHFSGRMSRLEWWGRSMLMYLLIILGLAVIAAAAAALDGGNRGMAGNGLKAAIIIGVILGVAAVIALIVAGISLDVRRLHDMDLSGWWVLLLRLGSIIPYAGFVVWLGSAIWLGFAPGTQGQNRFGPDPRT